MSQQVLPAIPRAQLLGRAREGGIIYPFIILFIVLALWKGETFYGRFPPGAERSAA